jgi:hypothetical protein
MSPLGKMMDCPERIGLSTSNELGSWRTPRRALAPLLSEEGGMISPAVARPRLITGGNEGPTWFASMPSSAITRIPRSANCAISSPICDSFNSTAARSRMIGRPTKNAGELPLRLSSAVSHSVIGAVGERTKAMSERPCSRIAPCGRTAIAFVTRASEILPGAHPISALRG